MADLIDQLVGVVAGDPIDALRAKRPTARSDAQTTYEALFVAPSDRSRASTTERAALAYWTAALSAATETADHYRQLLEESAPAILAVLDAALPGAITHGPYGSYPPGPLSEENEEGVHWSASAPVRQAAGDRLAAALEHAHLLTFHPRDASPDALQALVDAGWDTDGIVTVSQLIAFVHFQLRVVAGLTVLKEAN